MSRRIAALAVALTLLALATPAQAQPAEKIRRIGYFSGRSAAQEKRLLPAFIKGLAELGYIEGKNVIVEKRIARGRGDLLPALASDLLRQKVEVIVSSGGSATRVLKQASMTIPIVFAVSADLVGIGLVASLARPGGNITGLSDSHSDLIAKRLELLKEVVPSASRVAVLWNPATSIHPPQWRQIQKAAPAFGVLLLSLEVRSEADFERAFAKIENRGQRGSSFSDIRLSPRTESAFSSFPSKIGCPPSTPTLDGWPQAA